MTNGWTEEQLFMIGFYDRKSTNIDYNSHNKTDGTIRNMMIYDSNTIVNAIGPTMYSILKIQKLIKSQRIMFPMLFNGKHNYKHN